MVVSVGIDHVVDVFGGEVVHAVLFEVFGQAVGFAYFQDVLVVTVSAADQAAGKGLEIELAQHFAFDVVIYAVDGVGCPGGDGVLDDGFLPLESSLRGSLRTEIPLVVVKAFDVVYRTGGQRGVVQHGGLAQFFQRSVESYVGTVYPVDAFLGEEEPKELHGALMVGFPLVERGLGGFPGGVVQTQFDRKEKEQFFVGYLADVGGKIGVVFGPAVDVVAVGHYQVVARRDVFVRGTGGKQAQTRRKDGYGENAYLC